MWMEQEDRVSWRKRVSRVGCHNMNTLWHSRFTQICGTCVFSHASSLCVSLSLSVELDHQTAGRNERRQLTGCDNMQIKNVIIIV